MKTHRVIAEHVGGKTAAMDVAKGIAKEELNSEKWLRLMARLSKRSYEQMRVTILEFLDTDIFHVSIENCVAFLDPLIDPA